MHRTGIFLLVVGFIFLAFGGGGSAAMLGWLFFIPAAFILAWSIEGDDNATDS